VVGHTCSSATFAAQAVYAAEGVPMVSASSTGPHVTEQGYTTTFRVITRDESPTIMLAGHLADKLMFESAAIVEIDTFFGNWANDAFSDTFTGLGGSITSRHTITSSEDFTATLSTIMVENPDVIHFANNNGSTAGLLSKVAANVGMNGVVIAWSTFSVDRDFLSDYAAVAGDAAEGDIAAMVYRTKEQMPGYEEFNAAYQDAGFANFGDEADIWGAFAYDAANMLIAALSRTESADPADIRDEFALTSNYSGVVGTYEGFDSKGDVIPQWAWLERYQNGNWIKELPNRIYLPLTLNE
jgi:branched-chain amino acid transport system substrate-binding protein